MSCVGENHRIGLGEIVAVSDPDNEENSAVGEHLAESERAEGRDPQDLESNRGKALLKEPQSPALGVFNSLRGARYSITVGETILHVAQELAIIFHLSNAEFYSKLNQWLQIIIVSIEILSVDLRYMCGPHNAKLLRSGGELQINGKTQKMDRFGDKINLTTYGGYIFF